MTTTTSNRLLPDPEPRPIDLTVISVDDHLVEPPHMFEGRLPARLQPLAPRVVEDDDGNQAWRFDGEQYELPCLGAVAGRPRDEWTLEPTRFDQVRPGCYDIEARVHDMDLNGVWASVNFPSQITGFCGSVFARCADRELGIATVRAWNDWYHDEWYAPHPDRSIPMGITYLADPVEAAAEVRRNAERGFRALTFPELPHRLGLPTLHSGAWDPLIEACVETETVICLHIGSAGFPTDITEDAPILQLGGTLFATTAVTAAAHWLWSGYAFRHPTLKVAFSEAGIGWVAMFIDRLDHIVDRAGYDQLFTERPSDVFRRNFWFCSIDDRSTISTRDAIGVDNICIETDYPHADGTWPDSQATLAALLTDLDDDELARVTHENAAALFRHPLPPPDSPHAAGLRKASA